MKKLFYLLCVALVAITVFVISCKKGSHLQLNDQETLAIDQAKSWYKTKVLANGSNRFNLEPLWEEAEVKKSKFGEEIIIVPANNGNKTGNPAVGMVTSFVFSGDARGIQAGNIVKIVGDGQYIEKQGQNVVLQYKNQSVVGLKKGVILIYDVNQKFLIGGTIKNGALAPDLGSAFFKGGLSAAKLSSTKLQNLPSTFSTQGEGENCTDWYWTTWDTNTGQVLSEVFVYRTCETATSGDGPIQQHRLMRHLHA